MGRINSFTPVKSFKHLCFVMLLSTFIASCGGGQSNDSQTSTDSSSSSGSNSGNSNNGNGNQDPTDPVVTSPLIKIVAFDYLPKALNRQYRSTEVQQTSVTNVTGQFRLPIAGQNLTGNITVAVDVEDPDGIQNVYVGFSGATTAVELCASDCGTSFHKVITGLNPLDFNLGSGSPRLELWSLDTQGTKLPIATVEFNWQATFISGLNIARTNNQIDVVWNALSNYLRYNVYIATQAGVTADNYQTLPDGEAFLAIRNPAHIINGKDNAKTFYTTVTGIDGSGESAFSQNVMVAALNGDIDLPPTAIDDIYTMDEDTTLTQDVTANDFDSESQILTINPTLITNPINGTVTTQESGLINYTPHNNFSGTDHFSYQVKDGQNNTDTATVVIQINQTNDAPEASYNSYNIITTENRTPNSSQQRLAAMTVQAPGLLINDIDIDNNPIEVSTEPLSAPTQGTVVINPDGSFTYTNNEGATGEDQFTYQTIDSNGATAQAIVRIAINGNSFPPIAATDRYTINQDQTLNADNSTQGRLSLLSNDIDFDTTEGFIVRKVRSENHGFASIDSSGTFTYIPNAGFYGIDSFIYEVADPQGNTAQAGVLITVEKQNNPPTANPDSYIFDEDTSFTASINNGLTSNDIDVDLDNISITTTPISPPSNGTVSLSTDGSFTYTPTANFAGTDTFSYQLNDNQSATSTGQVTLTITNINDNPIAQNDTQQTLIDTPINLDVLANDSDAENDPLTITTASATNGTVINNQNNLDYTPASGFTGEVQINYTISDGQGGSANATVFLAVSLNNLPPIANNDSYTSAEDQTLTISAANGLLTNDSSQNGNTLTINQSVFTPPNNGQVNLNSNGSFSYTPNANTFGTDSFVYQLLDSNGASATATVTLSIASVNDNPQAQDDNFIAAEETLINLNVLANDSDIENDPLTIVSAIAGNATVSIENDNTLNYIPNLNFFGPDIISYTISDNNGGQSSAIATINVQNVNDNPIAVNDSATTDENTPVIIDVLANDSDIDGDTLSVLTATSSQGTISNNNDNTITFTPNPNINGSAQINYTLSDGNGATASAQVLVTINAVNDNPIAQDDNATTDEDSPININVLANDSDIDGDSLSISSANANNGQVSIINNDTLSYIPNANFNGSDTINYTISDNNTGQDSAIVIVTINPINDNPTAINDAIVINEDSTAIINVLANDFDIDNNQSQLQITSANANFGSVSVQSDNNLTYQPATNFTGTDTIIYQITDGQGGTASATVSVTVNNQNDAPIANNDSFTTDEDIAITLNVLTNDTDADNDPLIITNATTNQGSITNNSTSLLYQGPSNFNGIATVSYTISDGQGGNASATALITINSINDLPIANNDSATTAENTPISIDVLANDSDIESSQLTLTTASATNGQVTINNNVLVYSPNTQFSGNDIINYTISDNNGATASAIVNVTITNINDMPIANADSASLDEDTTANINPLTNDTDPDGDPLTISNAQASNGRLTNNGQTLTYAPNANYNGADIINYTITDGQGGTASSIINVTINPINDLPIAVNDSATVDEDTQTLINVLANDSDTDGDQLIVTTATANQGTVSIQADQTLNYQPNSDFNGNDTISYTISDNNGGTASSTVSLSINSINDNPIANNDIATTDEDSAITIQALANDTDADNDTLIIQTATASNGSVIINNSQSLTFTPNANFNGSDTINYTISDNQGGSASATIVVTINPINDQPIAVNDSATTNEDTALIIDVLSNDSDLDNDTLTITSFSATSGQVLVTNNQLNYTPNSDFNGPDTIDYTISDGQGGSASAQVFIQVSAVNDLPIANNDNATTDEDSNVIINALANDTDTDGDTLTISTASAIQGTVQILPDNQLNYAPNNNINGTDTISYTIADGQGGTNSASITITINAINDTPELTADTSTTDEDTTILINVLANDTDIDNDPLTISSATASNGTAIISSNQISYNPNENFNGNDIITYSVSDGQGASAQSTVSITINAINDLPQAIADTATGNEDTIISVNVLANDTDIDNDTLIISQASSNDTAGTVTINGNNIDYQPSENFNGLTTISYQITDGNGGQASSTATVTVTAINDAPIANNDTASVDEDTNSTLNVLLNDSDIDGDSLTIQSATANFGDVIINSDLTLSYIPNNNFNGNDTITYIISDGNLTASASASITINAINDLPEPQPDTASTDEDFNILIDVLANDTDPENDTLSIDIANAANGSTNIENGQIKYAPNANYNGTDTINYQISDGNGGVATSTVIVSINAINDNPVALADSAQTNEDSPISINALANDSDIDGDTLTIINASANNGSAQIATIGFIDYTPNANFNGTDIISYTISDGQLSATNIITVSVGGTNDGPKAENDTATTDEDQSVTIDALANDTDIDGDPLSYTNAIAGSGSVSISSTGLIYTPNANFNGTDNINYTISDLKGGTANATVVVTINPINDAPIATNDIATTNEDTKVTIDVLKNDGDIDGDTLTITSTSENNGTVIISRTNSLDYTPDANFNGIDTITYTITDDKLTASASITVTVNPVNDDPIANDDTASTNEDTLVNINVLANDSDPDGNLLNVSNPSASNGSVAVKSDQSIDYTPNTNFNGTDTITYTASNNNSSVTANVAVTINPINDNPVLADATATIAENSANGTSVANISASDIDLADNNSNESLSYIIQSNSANIFAINPNSGLITIDDNTNLNYESATSHSIIVKVDDANGGADTANITINVSNVEENATPTLDNNFAATNPNPGIAASNALLAGDYSLVEDAILDSNGRLIVVGRNGYSDASADYLIARFTTDGHLDRTFGKGGIITKDLGNEETAHTVNIDANDNILIAGISKSTIVAVASSSNTFIARYTSAGILDTSFNTTGYNLLSDSTTNAIAGIEFNGNDIYLGISHYLSVPIVNSHQKVADTTGFKLLKFDSSGSLTNSANQAFQSGPDYAAALLKQSDNKLMIVGHSNTATESYNFAAARFNISATPSVDSSYGNSGSISKDFGLSIEDEVHHAVIDSNDNIYLVGSTYIDASAYYTDVAAMQLDNTGNLVNTFGNSGILILDADNDNGGYSDKSIAKSIALDRSENLYFGLQIGDGNTDLAIHKTDPNGAVQTAFGNSGRFDINIENGNDLMSKVLIDASDKIVFASTSDPNVEPDLVVARLTNAGAYDNSFNKNGYNRIDTDYSTDKMNHIIELSAAPNTGKLAAVGVAMTDIGNRLIAARYNTDGSIDNSFGNNGYFILQGAETDYSGEDIIEQSDGKLVIAGHQDSSGKIIRLNTDGELDQSFANSGIYTYSPGFTLGFNAIAIDSNNNIIAGGTINNSGDDGLLVRLTSSGNLDTSFNASGIGSIDLGLNESIEDIAITPTNDIIAVGQKGTNAWVVKVTNSGTIDTINFGTINGGSFDGYLAIDLDTIASTNNDTLRQVKILSDGSIIAAGESTDSNPIATIIKLTSAGVPDTSFDSDGIAQFNFSQTGSQINGLDIDANERLIITGHNANGTDNDILLARINSNGTPDTLFNSIGGKLWDYGSTESAHAVIVKNDGTIIIAGSDNLNLFPTDFFFIQKVLLVEP